MGNFKPSIDSYEFLINKKINLEELNSKPFPFLLANTIEDKIFKNSINDFQFEWKYDGIRTVSYTHLTLPTTLVV